MTSIALDRQIETPANRAPHADAIAHRDDDALTFADPALEEFAAAAARNPLSLAGWALAAMWNAMCRTIARKLDIE